MSGIDDLLDGLKLRKVARVQRVFSTEADFSRKLRNRIPGAIPIENKVLSGVPDLCVPTLIGWVWLELKMFKGKRIEVKKSQIAFCSQLAKKVRPEDLPRWVCAKDNGEVFIYTTPEILEARRKPRKGNMVSVWPPEAPGRDIRTAVQIIKDGFIY